jgi:hypothetical protein
MKKIERATAALGGVAGALALCLFALALATSGSQAMFQTNRPAAEFAALMVSRAAVLRADLTIDFIFLVVYATFFLLLGQVLVAWADNTAGAAKVVIIKTAVGALLVTAVLDAFENSHLLAMLSMAEQSQPIPQGEIVAQMIESQVKFSFSYFGLFLLSFALPSESSIKKITVFALRWLQLPIGIGIFVLASELVRPLLIARAVFFFAGLWATAWIVWRRSVTAGAGRSNTWRAPAIDRRCICCLDLMPY